MGGDFSPSFSTSSSSLPSSPLFLLAAGGAPKAGLLAPAPKPNSAEPALALPKRPPPVLAPVCAAAPNRLPVLGGYEPNRPPPDVPVEVPAPNSPPLGLIVVFPNRDFGLVLSSWPLLVPAGAVVEFDAPNRPNFWFALVY